MCILFYFVILGVFAKGAFSQDATECVCFEELPAAREFINPCIVVSAEDSSDRLFVGNVWFSINGF